MTPDGEAQLQWASLVITCVDKKFYFVYYLYWWDIENRSYLFSIRVVVVSQAPSVRVRQEVLMTWLVLSEPRPPQTVILCMVWWPLPSTGRSGRAQCWPVEGTKTSTVLPKLLLPPPSPPPEIIKASGPAVEQQQSRIWEWTSSTLASVRSILMLMLWTLSAMSSISFSMCSPTPVWQRSFTATWKKVILILNRYVLYQILYYC